MPSGTRIWHSIWRFPVYLDRIERNKTRGQDKKMSWPFCVRKNACFLEKKPENQQFLKCYDRKYKIIHKRKWKKETDIKKFVNKP